MGAWILIGVALYALITLAGYLDRRDVRREEQERLRGLGWNPPVPMASASGARPAPVGAQGTIGAEAPDPVESGPADLLRNQPALYGQGVKLILAWALVGLPLLWGVLQTLDNALKLFK